MSFYDKIISHPSALKTIEKLSYTKAVFEHNYYKYLRNYHFSTKHKINDTIMALCCVLFGYLTQIVLIATWKSYKDWSFVELVSIGYFYFNSGYYIGPLITSYLDVVSQGRFDHSKYNFEKLKTKPGDSYLNPIDLTIETKEEQEAADALLSFMKEPTPKLEKEIKTE